MSSLRGPRFTDPESQPCLSHPQGASCCFTRILTLHPESYQAPRQQLGWALSPEATTSLQGRQEVWGKDTPSRINKTNSQNQIPAFLRRQKGPQSSSGEAKNVLFVARKSLCGRPYRLMQGNGTPRVDFPLSPRSETGRMRFGILGPKGQDTLQAGLSEELAGLGSKEGGSKYSSL